MDRVPFNIHCQSNGVLFQFLLSEYVQSIACVKKMESERLCLSKKAAHTKLLFDFQHYIPALHSALSLSISSPQVTPYLWGNNEGSLNKLLRYTTQLSERIAEDQTLHELLTTLDLAIECGFDALRHTSRFQESKTKATSPLLYAHLTGAIEKMSHFMDKITKLIFEVINTRFHNENVLLFLMKHRTTLQSQHADDPLSNLLETLYPKGLEETRTRILKEFKKRGFKEWIPSINKTLTDLIEVS